MLSVIKKTECLNFHPHVEKVKYSKTGLKTVKNKGIANPRISQVFLKKNFKQKDLFEKKKKRDCHSLRFTPFGREKKICLREAEFNAFYFTVVYNKSRVLVSCLRFGG